MKGRLVTALIIALAVVAVSAFAVSATGTPSGTIITNNATLNYKDVNNNAKTQVTATVDTLVLTKRGVDVSPATIAAGVIEDKVTEYPFTILNTGNATDTIALAVAGSNADAGWVYEILFDANGNGVWDTGEETDVTTTPALLQDTSYKVIVRVTAPPVADYNGANTVTLTATGLASTDGGSAAASDTGVITLDLSSANVTMTKVASTTTPVPLTPFTYTIEVKNSDLETPAYSVVMTDILDADLAYVRSVVSHGSITAAPAVDASGTITWTIGTLAANTTATLTLTVYVKEETPQGNAITNTATLAYTDSNLNPFTDTASSTPGTAQELADVAIATAYISPTYVDPGDFIVVPFTIQNTGNGPDTYDLTDSDAGTLALNYTFYKDANGDGILVAGVDFTDFDGNGVLSQGDTILMTPITNTGELTKDQIMTFVAIASVPTTALLTDTSNVTITATSTSDPANAYMSFTALSEVVAPVLTLAKAVDKTSAQPGETLTYTLTIVNTGDGIAYGVVLVDAIPANTTYVASSITVGGVAQSDVAADDFSDYNLTNVGAVTVKLPTIAAGATIIVTFQVTIN